MPFNADTEVALPMSGQPHNLEELLYEATLTAKGRRRISLGEITRTVGQGSFGSLLLLAGVMAVSPLGGIPGMPSAMGILVLLVASQMLLGKPCCWLPRWLVSRSVDSQKLGKAVGWLYKPARSVDHLLRRRLQSLVVPPGNRFLALTCALVGIGMPLMELVPFSIHSAGAVVTLFGLAVIARDGRLALLAYGLTALTTTLVVIRLS